MDNYKSNAFVFSSKYRVLRHVVFWLVNSSTTNLLASNFGGPFTWQRFLGGGLWIPVTILYCYPIIYWILPKYLLKGKYLPFALIMILWGIAGWFLNYCFRAYIFIPVQEYQHLPTINKNPWASGTLMYMNATLGFLSVMVMFKYWAKKQQEWMKAEREKITAELQLLKAQVHPHFLFNTLNNIYSFSLENSPKTPGLILKLSSLLSYMLYDCRAEEVLLEKEIEVMKNYIDLEKERYGNRIEISLNIEGDIKDKYITPLLLLPFLENAFKHGTSEQLEKPWLSMDLSVKQNTMKCKIVNSKNEYVPVRENGIGIQNVKKRLEFLYPGNYELRINNEDDFFVVSLLLELKKQNKLADTASVVSLPVAEKASI